MDSLVGHFRRYTTSDFKRYKDQKQQSLSIEYLGYADPLGFFVTLMYRAFGSRKGAVSPLSIKVYDKMIFPFSKLIEPVTKNLFGKNVAFIARKL